MTRFDLTMLAVLLLLLQATSSRAQTVQRSQAQSTPTREQQKIALVVGVERYQKAGFRDLQFAESDAQKMRDELSKLGFAVDAVIGDEASLGKLQKAFNAFVAKSRSLNKGDIALVYMSGHGVQKQVETIDKDGTVVQSEEPFFCPNDAIKSDAKTLLSLNAVLQGLERSSGSETNIIFLDACRDSVDRSSKGIDGSTIKSLSDKLALFFAAKSGHRSFESSKLQHGIFTYYLLEGIRGAAADSDQEITFQGLANYVSKRVHSDSPELLSLPPDQAQRPNLMGNLSGTVVLGRLSAGSNTSNANKLTDEEYAALYKEASEHVARYDDPASIQPLLDRVANATRGTSFSLAIRAIAVENAGDRARDVEGELVALSALASSIDPDSAHTHYLNGLAARKQGETAKAIACFRKAIERNPYLVDAHLGIVWADTEDAEGDPAAGMNYATSLIAQYPDDYRVYNAYGTRLFNAENWHEGLKNIEEAILLCPDNPLLWNNKGYGLHGAKRFSDAMAAYKKAGELGWEGSPWILTNASEFCLAHDPPQLDDARRFATRAIELDPTFHGPWVIIAKIKYHLDDTQGAMETISQSLQKVTNVTGKLEIITTRISIHLQQSNLTAAEADVRLLEELAGGNIYAFAAPKSALLARQGRKVEAGQLIDKVVTQLRAENSDASVIQSWQQFKNELMAR